MYSICIQNGEGFFVVYDISSRVSFEEVETFIAKFVRIKEKNLEEIPIFIIGNKSDLDKERKVTFKEGKELANKHKVGFYETSAKAGENVEKIFEEMCFLVWEKEYGMKQFRLIEWSKEYHSKLPESFRERIETLLLILKRNELENENLKLPKPILFELLIKRVFEMECKCE